jgi:creatinine amidohydrolase
LAETVRRTVELGRMSWAEIAEVAVADPIVLLPIGTVEQHGPHLPVNADNMVAEYVAIKAATRTNALVAPSINYGYSATFRKFAGTLSVRQETLAAMLRDVSRALTSHGFRRIVFVDNHGGNEPVCEQIARELKSEQGIVIGSVYPWKLGYQLMRNTYEDADRVYGHGAEPETSAMMAMFPDDVLHERIEAAAFVDTNRWQSLGPDVVVVPGQKIGGTVYLDSDEITHNGVTGDGSVASTERGQVWIERVVGFTVDFVNHYDQVTAEMQREG